MNFSSIEIDTCDDETDVSIDFPTQERVDAGDTPTLEVILRGCFAYVRMDDLLLCDVQDDDDAEARIEWLEFYIAELKRLKTGRKS